jgi:hypothetical protein
MCQPTHPSLPPCPDPRERAPRALRDGAGPHARLYPAPPALRGAVVALVCRDTRGFALSDAQRLTHFPATPLVTLSWFQGLDAGLATRDADGVRWEPFGATLVLSGSQSQPTASWAPTTGRGGIVCFPADAARELFGLDLAAIHDRTIDARGILGPAWQPLLDALLATRDDATALHALEAHLGPRWDAMQVERGARGSAIAALRESGRQWVERLAWQAREWQRTHGARQVERRIKAYSGRSLREWQALVKTEGVFFSARERYEAGMPFDWAGIAQDEGFADQAHLSRMARRITGFAPGEFARRFGEDESFWLYRLWV